MKTFHVKVALQTLEIYEVEAENADEAYDSWPDGRLICADDEILDCEVLSVKEA